MKLFRLARIAALSCSLVLLAGCAAFSGANHELDVATKKLITGNISVSNGDTNAPKAEITPRGDFLIAGKSVPLTPQQRAETLHYREQMVQIGMQAIAVSRKGVAVGMGAAVPMAFAALFGGSDKEIDQHMNARLSGVYADAAKICDRLPAVMAAQQQLTRDLPAFKPYATLTQKNIDGCRQDVLHDINVAEN